MKALLRLYFFPSSLLRSLLASEDLASSSWKFALIVYLHLLDGVIVDFNVLEFILLFVFVYSCQSWLKLPTPLLNYVVLL